MAAQNPTNATPTSFYTLPNEILVQIFSNKSLSNKDLTNAYNPELNSGHQIVSITVEWHRRVAKSEDTWTKPWFWTTAEQSKLETPICYKYRFTDETRLNILHLCRNSESLLPLLSYFTPNLKSLDLGNIDRRIVDDTGAKCTQSLEALRSYWDRSPERVYRDEREALEADETAKCQDGIGSRRSETILPPIFGLPGIESIQVSFTTNGEHKDGYSPKYNFDAKSTSSVKYLELSVSCTGGHSEEYFFSLAKLTGNLSRVNIHRKYKSGEITRTLEGGEEIARTFLQYNKTTLQLSKIFINGGGFNDDGDYDGDAERRKWSTRSKDYSN
ncbi:hypothetical protein EYR41_006625 [Orbilia oligospora]|uniref:Uncharacterized protein n=1 Tax=Orbilia oligospora TaxID=2813651 RepID=A0A8H2DWD5_ORBOL|nr:hypothetical protein EYR41_006625 [Orbilia oligospora]